MMEYILIGIFLLICLIASGVIAYNISFELDIETAILFFVLFALFSIGITFLFALILINLTQSFGYYAYLILGSLPVIGYGFFILVKIIHKEIYGGLNERRSI
jgi:hypothetical protein